MDWQGIAITALGILCTSYGWFISGIVRDQKGLEKSLADFKDSVPKVYVSKHEDDRRWDQLMQAIYRIETKIDGKADK
jgi:hypothetical protein